MLLCAPVFAQGHDISTVRYAPSGQAGGAAMWYDGRSFVTAAGLNYGLYIARTDPSSGATAPASAMALTSRPSQTPETRWLSHGFMAAQRDGITVDVTDLRTNTVSSISHRALAPAMVANGVAIAIVDRSEPFVTGGTGRIIVLTFGRTGGAVVRATLPVSGGDAYDVASSGDGFVVATAGVSGVHLFRIDASGAIASDQLLQARDAVVELSQRVSVAATAARTVVAWTYTGPRAGYVASVSAAGEISAPEALPPVAAATVNDPVQVLATRSGYVVIWGAYVPPEPKVMTAAVRLNEAAHLLDATPIIIAERPFLGAASSLDVIAVATTQVYPRIELGIATFEVRGDGFAVRQPIVSPVLVPATQRNVKLASDGVDFVGVWEELESTGFAVMAGRVDRSGVPLDGPGVKLPLQVPDRADIALARGAAGEALIVVGSNNGVYAFRWSRSAGVLDPVAITLSVRPATGAAVAWNGTRYVAVWSEQQQLGTSITLRLITRSIGTDGSPAPPNDIAGVAYVGPPDKSPQYPAIAWDGHQFLVTVPMVTIRPCTMTCGPPVADEIRLVRLSADGAAFSERPTSIPGVHANARIATSGSEFLLAFDDGTFRLVKAGVNGIDIGLERRFFTATYGQVAPSDVVWDGSAYLIAWTYTLMGGGPAGIGSMRIASSGDASSPTYVATETPSDYAPSVAANDAGETAVALDEVTRETLTSRARIYLSREFHIVPPPPAAPRNFVSHLLAPVAVLSWESNDDAAAFLVERAYGALWSPIAAFRGDVRQTTVYAHAGDVLRIRSIGPGGVSPAGPVTIVGNDPRIRTVRP